MMDYSYIRKFEKEGKWREAEKLWNSVNGYKEDAAACKMIADAIEEGDRQREIDKTTQYTIIETIGGHFTYLKGTEPSRITKRVIGHVYGISKATDVVVALQENKESLKANFPELDI